jgi:hypothetical protein
MTFPVSAPILADGFFATIHESLGSDESPLARVRREPWLAPPGLTVGTCAMNTLTIDRTLLALVVVTALGGCASTTQPQPKLTESQATDIGADVYIYGYPLVTLEMTRRLTTNTVEPIGLRAPMGQFAHLRSFPPITYRDIPGANADTLYSAAWLDLGKEPYVLSIPDAEGRYFMMPMLDGWSEVFQAPGTRTTGGKPQTYVVTGPKWKGELPAGMSEYKSATNMVWIIGRTYTTGTAQDYEKVHAFQDKLSLRPLSTYGRELGPPKGKLNPDIDMRTPTRDQVVSMDAATYFKLLATLLKDNPPRPADAAIVSEMAQIGLIPGKDWDIRSIDANVAAGLAKAPRAALARMAAHEPNAGKVVNGWVVTGPAGIFGTNYLQRALLNWQGPGWNRVEDAVYPLTRVDGEGKTLNGANHYVIHFAKGGLPPVKGFWSLTMYDSDGYFVANPIDRVSLSQRSEFTLNADGSLDLLVQKDSPGKQKEANWLPCPQGDFGLFLRLYWPNESSPSIVDGTWGPPPVRRVAS